MRSKFLLSTAASIGTAMLLCASAAATPIRAGQSVTASQIGTGSLTSVAIYSNVAFTSQAPAGQASTFSGTYSDGVYRDSGNTLCGVAGQCLTFFIQVGNNPTSADGIRTVTTGPLSNLFIYNVGYQSPIGGVAPIVISDSANGDLSFNFTSASNTSGEVSPGQSSDFLLIQTSATNFTAGDLSFQGNQTANVAGFIPSTPAVVSPTGVTPEPSSFALLGTGVLGAFGLVRKRFV